MRKFYQLSHSNGQDTKVILASTKYEAIGFYLFEEVESVACASLDRVKILPPEHVFTFSYGGFQVNKTVEELWKEKDDWIFPKTVLSLVGN